MKDKNSSIGSGQRLNQIKQIIEHKNSIIKYESKSSLDERGEQEGYVQRLTLNIGKEDYQSSVGSRMKSTIRTDKGSVEMRDEDFGQIIPLSARPTSK